MAKDDFADKALRKVPVAQTVLTTLANILTPELLEPVYEENRGRCYESVLSFETIVGLLISTVLVHNGSGRQSFRDARLNDEVDATDQAIYGKIARMPAAVSQELLHAVVPQLKELLPDSVVTDVPKCFNHLNVYGIDGKKLKDVAKRLKETRGKPGKMLGGKTLVALSVHERIVVAMNSSLDGEVNDGPLVPGLLESVCKITPEDNLFLFDSQFCDLTTPNRVLAKGSDFIVRYHPKTGFHQDNQAPAMEGKDASDRCYVDEVGWLGKPGSKTSISVRRITVKRTDNTDLVIITSLLDSTKYCADDVLELYGLRWTIETVFQHVTKEFDLRKLIGSTPEATIFQFSISLILYNISVLIQQHVSQTKELNPEEVSMPKLVREVKKQLAGIGLFVGSAQIARVIKDHGTSTSQTRTLLSKCWNDDWKKAPKNRRNPPVTPPKKSGSHTSVFRAIRDYHAS